MEGPGSRQLLGFYSSLSKFIESFDVQMSSAIVGICVTLSNPVFAKNMHRT